VLAGAEGRVRGVDSDGVKGDPAEIARKLADKLGIVVAMSGATDIVTDGMRTLLVDNGHPMMGLVSGTGCMASSVTGAFATTTRDHVTSTAAAMAALGIAGERAAERYAGPSSYKIALLDETYRLKPEDLYQHAKVREG